MKVLLINGSPHKDGSTNRALTEVCKTLNQEGIETEIVHVGHLPIRGCTACTSCYKTGKCVFDDEVNKIAKKFEEADGLVIGSPVYYSSPNGTLISLLDRLFYSTHFNKMMKVGASVVSCRRGGNSSSFDVLNKYFTNKQVVATPFGICISSNKDYANDLDFELLSYGERRLIILLLYFKKSI